MTQRGKEWKFRRQEDPMHGSKNPSTAVSRRTFLAAATALPAASLIEPLRADARPEDPAWYSTMRRCGQINYNEKDPLNIDPEAWMDYWASLKVNAVLVNGGGIMAFYPTQVPYHHRSEFLGSRDVLGEMVAAAKKRGFRVVARMDCNLAYQEALEARPEWFERNRDGSARPHAECPWLYKTCAFSTYFTEQMPAIYREINAHYSVDGFFTNGWPSTAALGVCYCDACQKVFREKVGGVPPETTDASSLLYRRYYAAYMDRVLEIWKLWHSVAQEKKPDSVYVGNLGGGIDTVKSVKKLAEVAAWFNADHQGRSGTTPVWNCAQQGRVAQSVMNGRAITNVTGAYAVGRPTWRHTAQSSAELRMWLAQTVASGMVPWFHWLGGSPEDTRWRNVGREFFAWLASNEADFCNRRSVADLAVLYPQSTVAFYRRGGGRDPAVTGAEYLQGLYYALLEGRFLFDFVHQENLSAQALARYRALLVPNAAYLRDRECEAIRQYVRSGGSLLATFETSRYNEWGDPRQELGLADVLGVSLAGEVMGPHANGYMRIEKRHELAAGFEGTNLLPGGEYRLPIRQRANSAAVLTVVPNYPAFPPEMVYPRTPHTSELAASFREEGSSRVAYFAGDVDRTFWGSGNADLCRVLHNAIRWLRRGSTPPATVTGDGLVEIFAWETEPGYALHVLNYTNPNALRGPFRRIYPLGAQQVEFRTERRIASVRALKAAASLPFHQQGENVSFVIPAVEDYEVIALT
jgi:hypothetical protein